MQATASWDGLGGPSSCTGHFLRPSCSLRRLEIQDSRSGCWAEMAAVLPHDPGLVLPHDPGLVIPNAPAGHTYLCRDCVYVAWLNLILQPSALTEEMESRRGHESRPRRQHSSYRLAANHSPPSERLPLRSGLKAESVPSASTQGD